jgi:DNA-binding response OmpR family regulator
MTSLFCLGWSQGLQPVKERPEPVRTTATRKPAAGIALDCPAARRVVTPTGPVLLSPREWALLSALMAKPGVTQARSELLHAVWGPNYSGTPRVVDVRVGHLRRKLEVAAGSCIETVHGSGYRFAPAARSRR